MSFASNVHEFWTQFNANLPQIKADLEAQNFEKASRIVEDTLKICLSEPTFMVGLKDGAVDLVLTPEGQKAPLFWLEFIKNNMPSSLLGSAVCTLGKQKVGKNFGFKMYGADVTTDDILTYPRFDEQKFDLEIYNEQIATLLQNNENEAYNLAFILLDNALGEICVINALGALTLLKAPKKNGVKLSDLGALVERNLGADILKDPLLGATVYRLEPRGDEVREDVVVGSSRLTEIINEYLSGEREIFKTAAANGIKICFLSYGVGGAEGLEIRAQVEDELEECGEFLQIIGGASGTQRAYTDLICYDEERLAEILPSIEAKFRIKIGVHDFTR